MSYAAAVTQSAACRRGNRCRRAASIMHAATKSVMCDGPGSGTSLRFTDGPTTPLASKHSSLAARVDGDIHGYDALGVTAGKMMRGLL